MMTKTNSVTIVVFDDFLQNRWILQNSDVIISFVSSFYIKICILYITLINNCWDISHLKFTKTLGSEQPYKCWSNMILFTLVPLNESYTLTMTILTVSVSFKIKRETKCSNAYFMSWSGRFTSEILMYKVT